MRESAFTYKLVSGGAARPRFEAPKACLPGLVSYTPLASKPFLFNHELREASADA